MEFRVLAGYKISSQRSDLGKVIEKRIGIM